MLMVNQLSGFGAASGGGAVDPLYTYVKALLNFETGITDAKGHTTSYTGDPPNPPVSGGYIDLPGAAKAVNIAQPSSDLTPGSSDFCFEWYFWADAFSGTEALGGVWGGGSFYSWLLNISSTNILFAWSTTRFNILTDSANTTVSTGAKHHCAVFRKSGTVYITFNGTVLKSFSLPDALGASTSACTVGYNEEGNQQHIDGRIYAFRSTIGHHRYADSIVGGVFTPDSDPFPEA